MHRKLHIVQYVLLPVVLIIACQAVCASESAADTNKLKGILFHKDIPDSVLLGETFRFHYVPNMVKIEEIEHPTFSATGTHYIDMLDRIDGTYYLSKGTMGQSHLSLYPTLGLATPWNYQPDINIAYKKTPLNVGFYQAMRPFTQLAYMSSTLDEYRIKAAHTQNIIPRWNVSLDIDFFNPENIYANSSTMNTYLDFTSNYYSKDSRFQTYFGYILQKLRMGENGGLSDDDYFRSYTSNGNLTGLPVNDVTHASIYKQTTLFTHNVYNTVRQVKTTKQRQRVEVSKTDSTKLDTIDYVDTLLPADLKVLNTGVIAFDADYNRWSRHIVDSTTTHCLATRLYWTNDAYPDARFANPHKVTIGVKPQAVGIVEHDTSYMRFYNLAPYAAYRGLIGIGTLSAEGSYNVGSNYMGGERRLMAQYDFAIDSQRRAALQVDYQAKAAEFFYYRYNNNGLQWQNSFDLSKTLRIEARYDKTQRLKATLTATHTDGYVYLGTDLLPHQADEGFWLLQGKVMYSNTFFDHLHCDLQQMLQYSSNADLLPVPVWATKNSIYCDFHLFHKALLVQSGVDIKYHTAFYADAYSMQAGAFYRQNDIKVGNYIWGDIFFNLQMPRAVIFIKLGHINSLWETAPNYFLLPHYPGNKMGLYYGVVWKFFD